MIEFVDRASFFDSQSDRMLYVGFMKSSDAWYPICMVSDPDSKKHLDTLFVSSSMLTMGDLTKDFKEQLSSIEDVFVQYLMMKEISNLMDMYGLENVAVVKPDEAGCSCGCGCS